jgi:hypothetical protein
VSCIQSCSTNLTLITIFLKSGLAGIVEKTVPLLVDADCQFIALQSLATIVVHLIDGVDFPNHFGLETPVNTLFIIIRRQMQD